MVVPIAVLAIEPSTCCGAATRAARRVSPRAFAPIARRVAAVDSCESLLRASGRRRILHWHSAAPPAPRGKAKTRHPPGSRAATDRALRIREDSTQKTIAFDPPQPARPPSSAAAADAQPPNRKPCHAPYQSTNKPLIRIAHGVA